MNDKPHAAVVSPSNRPMEAVPGAAVMMRTLIDRPSVGCQNLVQRVLRLETGASPEWRNKDSEDVIFVVGGDGEAEVSGHKYPLKPDTGLLVPAGSPYRFRHLGSDPLELVSVLSPQPGHPASVPPSPKAQPVGPQGASVHETQETPLPAGGDRYFKLMIDPRHGSRYVTQFIGFIKKSRAPFHTHTYEETIYILGGEGIVHIGDGDFPIRPGSSIYLPPGTPHCLENRSAEPLRLLGVFCPAGSPADNKILADQPET